MRFTYIALGMCLLGGCGPAIEVSPKEGSSFGHYPVTARSDQFAALADPLTVTVGGIAAYDVARVDGKTVRFTVQGSTLR